MDSSALALVSDVGLGAHAARLSLAYALPGAVSPTQTWRMLAVGYRNSCSTMPWSGTAM